MIRFLIAVLLMLAVSAGYRLAHREQYVTLPVPALAGLVGAVYGDGHPRLIRALATETEGPAPRPMYILTLTGHFRRGSRTARCLDFSILADGTQAFNLWAGDTLPSRTAHREWRVDVVPLGVAID